MTFLKIAIEQCTRTRTVATEAEATIESKEMKPEDRVYCGKRNVKGESKDNGKDVQKIRDWAKNRMKIKSI